MTSAGRPSKLTQETIKTLTDCIGLGGTYVDACTMAGDEWSKINNAQIARQKALSGNQLC